MSVNAPLWTLKLLPVWKQVFADKCLNETTEVVEVLLEIGLCLKTAFWRSLSRLRLSCIFTRSSFGLRQEGLRLLCQDSSGPQLRESQLTGKIEKLNEEGQNYLGFLVFVCSCLLIENKGNSLTLNSPLQCLLIILSRGEWRRIMVFSVHGCACMLHILFLVCHALWEWPWSGLDSVWSLQSLHTLCSLRLGGFDYNAVGRTTKSRASLFIA